MLVFLSHGARSFGFQKTQEFSYHFFESLGRFSVVGFFVLSGFILYYVYNERVVSIKQFAINRIARIYPLYITCLLIFLPIDWLSLGLPKTDREISLLLNITMFQSWFEFSRGRFNAPGWTISVELFFYISFPLLIFFLKKNPRWYFALLWVSILPLALSWDDETFNSSYKFPLMRLWEFTIGVYLGRIFINRKCVFSEKLLRLKYLFILGCLTVIMAPYMSIWSKIDFLQWFLYAISSATVIYMLALKDSSTGVSVSTRWIFLGEISFAIYLVHDGVLRAFSAAMMLMFNVDIKIIDFEFKLMFLAILVIITGAISIFLYRKVEIPFRKKIRLMFN